MLTLQNIFDVQSLERIPKDIIPFGTYLFSILFNGANNYTIIL